MAVRTLLFPGDDLFIYVKQKCKIFDDFFGKKNVVKV